MKTKKLVINIVAGVFVLGVIGIVVWIKYVPVQNIPFFQEQTGLVCLYPVRVAGSSMEPTLNSGQTVNFSKCFAPDSLEVGQIITYKEDSFMKIGIVREKSEGNYIVSQEARANDLHVVSPEKIVAVYND